MAAGAAQTRFRVEVLASWAALLAVRRGACSRTGSHSWSSSNNRALAALQLTRLRLVGSARAGYARLVSAVVEGADGTGYTVGYHNHLAHGAGILRAQFQGSRIRHCVGQNLLHGELIVLEDELLQQLLDSASFARRCVHHGITEDEWKQGGLVSVQTKAHNLVIREQMLMSRYSVTRWDY